MRWLIDGYNVINRAAKLATQGDGGGVPLPVENCQRTFRSSRSLYDVIRTPEH